MQRANDRTGWDYADVAQAYKRGFDALMTSSQAVISGCQAMNAELLAFGQSRFKQGVATQRQLAECTSPQSVYDVQLSYARMELEAYLDELRTLGDLTGQVFRDSVAPLKSRAEDAVKSPGSATA